MLIEMEVRERTEALAAIDCDDLLIGLFQQTEVTSGLLAELNQAMNGALEQLISQSEVSADYKAVGLVHTLGNAAARRLVFVGLGEESECTFVRARAALAKAVKSLTAKGEERSVVCFLPTGGKLTEERLGEAAAEAFQLAAYTYKGYREKPATKTALAKVTLLAEAGQLEPLKKGVATGMALSAGTNLARNLVNTPANYLTTEVLKDSIVEVAKRYHMEYEVLGQEELTTLGMGGVLAVARGSEQPPYVVVVKYQGRDQWEDIVGLVGKGVTFDSGGISIKPTAGMEEMKSDMGGAATMLGVLEAVGRLKPAVNLLLVIGCVENMPSGNAYRPGDVITTMSGKTVEIITTDAEGRLVLADCITYAKQKGVSCLIDAATLTGGVVVALGTITTGAMSNNQELVEQLLATAEEAGERLWQLPTFEEYFELNKSHVADLKNSGGRYGHAIVGGVFLQVFAEDTPWVHLDIAGTAYLNKANELGPIGATGAMTRTISRFLLQRGVN